MTVLLPLSLKPGSHPEVHCIDRVFDKRNKNKKEKEKKKKKEGEDIRMNVVYGSIYAVS